MRATQIGVVRRVVCASPALLAAEGTPERPQDLQSRDTIVVNNVRAAQTRWIFGAPGAELVVSVKPRLIVSGMQAALDAAVASGGFVRPLSYQLTSLEAAGLLRRVLVDDEPPPIPIHFVHPAGRHLALKTRLFIDRAVAALRGRFE